MQRSLPTRRCLLSLPHWHRHKESNRHPPSAHPTQCNLLWQRGDCTRLYARETQSRGEPQTSPLPCPPPPSSPPNPEPVGHPLPPHTGTTRHTHRKQRAQTRRKQMQCPVLPPLGTSLGGPAPWGIARQHPRGCRGPHTYRERGAQAPGPSPGEERSHWAVQTAASPHGPYLCAGKCLEDLHSLPGRGSCHQRTDGS